MAHSDYLTLLAGLSPAAYWPHDETSGTTLADDSGNSRNETTAGSPLLNQTTTIPSYGGPVVVMDGTNDTISVADAAVFDAVDAQGLTYHRWLKMDAAGSGDVLYIIADKTGTSQSNNQWGIWWDNRTSQGSPKRLRMTWGDNPSGTAYMDWTGDAARDALLAGGMFTFVFHPNSIGYIYLNKELVASGPLYNYPSVAANSGNTRTVQIGHLNGSSFFFKGEMGAGALWASQLTQADIENLYLAETSAAGTSTIGTITEIVSDTDYDSFAGHIKAPNGDLLVAYRKGTAHTTATSSQGIYQTRSTDGGSTWGTPTKILANDASTQYMTAGMSVIGSTCYLATWTRPLAGGASSPATAVKVYSSSDNGSTWTLASTLDLSTPFPNGAYTESKLISWGGYYYLAAYGYTSGTAGDSESGIWRTSDLSTWTRVATFDDGINGFNETDVQLIGSTLVAAIRHESSESCYTSTSTNGTTWSTPVMARKFAISAPRLSPVGPRGRAYMVQRYYSGGRGYLASIDETGTVRELRNLSGVIMYGQAAILDDDDISVAWSIEKSSSDADVSRAVYTISGYEVTGSAAVTAPAPAVSGAGLVTIAGAAAVTAPAPSVAGAGTSTVTGAAAVTAPAPSVVGIGTADDTSYGIGAVTAPAPAVTGAGVSVVTGSAAVTAPAPTVAGDGLGEEFILEVVLGCAVDVSPISVEVGGASGVTDVLTVNLDCSVEVSPYVLLRPVAPPLGVIAEWPVGRQAHIMAALSEANPRYTGGVDYDIERDETGRLHVFVGGTDVTYFRDMPSVFEDWSSSVPFGPESARIAMPQFKPWDNPGSGAVAMFREDAPVEIALVRPDDSIDHLWEGFLAVEGDQSGQTSEDYTFTADGLFAQAAHELYDPPVVMGERDYGHIIADVLNSVTHRRWTKIPRFTTGETTAYRGEQSQSKWQYVQDLLSRCYDDTDRQLTIARVAPYTYRIQWKKAVSGSVDWTVTKGAPGISVNLERNHGARVDAIYGRGYAPDGGFWCGRVFPGLDADVPPVYPMAGFANISVGTTDEDTTTGNGVRTWQRRMRELGYPVVEDGVMNANDTRWVRKIQIRKGLTVDDSLGPQTWAASWEDNKIREFDTYRLPLATRTQVEPHLYAANGGIVGKNPGDDTSVIRHAIEVDFKTNITKAKGGALSERMLARLQDVGYQGTITLLTDPHEAGSSRFDIKPGDNVHVIGHHGGVTVQVSEVSASGLEVNLTVDSLARDAEVVAAQLDRAEEARRDLSGRTGGSDSSRLNDGTVVQYEAESKAGRISRTAVNGNSGLWTIRRAFVSQVGVAKIEFETSPKAELVVALFNRPPRTSVLASLVPDPLANSDGWYDAVETLKGTYGCMEVFGSPDSPGGYWPRQKGAGSLTGKMRDSASTLYDSPYGGFVWVAMFTSRSTWVEGTVFPAVPT